MAHPKKNTTLDPVYWQDKATGAIFEGSPKFEPTPDWNRAYRRVRLLSHPESYSLIIEDFGTCLSALDDPCVLELTLDEFQTLKMLYDNPDL